MKDNEPNTACADVEGLLPLFAGGDLEGEDIALVAAHVAGCGRCSAGLEAAREARRELRAGLRASVGDHEPQLWPAIRAELAREGLLGAPAKPGPRSVLRGEAVDRNPARRASLPRVAAGIAAGFVAIFLVGQGLLGPENDPQRPAGPSGGTGAGQPVAEERGTTPRDLGPGLDSALAGGGVEVNAEASPSGGLRPVGFGTKSLFDEAGEDLLRDKLEERTVRSGTVFYLPDPASAGTGAEGDLASGFRLQ